MSFASDPEDRRGLFAEPALAPGSVRGAMGTTATVRREAYRTLPHERDLCYDPASGQSWTSCRRRGRA